MRRLSSITAPTSVEEFRAKWGDKIITQVQSTSRQQTPNWPERKTTPKTTDLKCCQALALGRAYCNLCVSFQHCVHLMASECEPIDCANHLSRCGFPLHTQWFWCRKSDWGLDWPTHQSWDRSSVHQRLTNRRRDQAIESTTQRLQTEQFQLK